MRECENVVVCKSLILNECENVRKFQGREQSVEYAQELSHTTTTK